MSLIIKPNDLYFEPPLNRVITQTLTLQNPSSSKSVAFKVKTTAPKRYCVRPNSGTIEPGKTREVEVLLQPMKKEGFSAEKCKDKFLVQSAEASGPVENASDYIYQLSKTDEAKIMQQKFKCIFKKSPEAGESRTEEPEKSSRRSSAYTTGQEHGGDDQAVGKVKRDLEAATKALEDTKRENERIKRQLEQVQASKSKAVATKTAGGFPFSVVLFVALLSLAVGYYLSA